MTPRAAAFEPSSRDPRGGAKIRVLLVDDHKLMCEGLAVLLGGAPDIDVVGKATDGRTAVELVKSLKPDVVVMDVGLPELNGVEATRRIQAQHQKVKVIALSAHADQLSVRHMLDAGANGYVLKIAAHDELLRAVRAASSGNTYLSPEIAGLVVDRAAGARPGHDSSVYSTLGPRQREILQLVAEGKTSGEIARMLHISIKTVETHRRNIVQRLGLHGTAELTKYAIREGLTTLGE